MAAHRFRGDYNISRDPLLQKALIAEGLTSCSLNIEKKKTQGPLSLKAHLHYRNFLARLG